jgi:2-iminobutanoate/2-iminopropanoate deaminase
MLTMTIIGPPIMADGQPLPYSTAVEAGGLLFFAGVLPMRDDAVCGETLPEQLDVALDCVEAALGLAGLTLDNVVKLTLWLTERPDYAAINRVYAPRFKAPYPARMIVVAGLGQPGALVEIEVIASRDSRVAPR